MFLNLSTNQLLLAKLTTEKAFQRLTCSVYTVPTLTRRHSDFPVASNKDHEEASPPHVTPPHVTPPHVTPPHVQSRSDEVFQRYCEKAEDMKHFKDGGFHDKRVFVSSVANGGDDDYALPHPIWSQTEAKGVKVTHRAPVGTTDRLAYGTVQLMRKSFDVFSGYSLKKRLQTLDERDMLRRCIFLETVAGVPGFAAAMVRHLQSLRRMERDHGWIHTLLEEAENERMHLMTFLQLRNPGPILRGSVALTQWIFTLGFSAAYLCSPNYCHRLVGYLEEQAVITYSHILEEMDGGRLPMWSKLPAPEIAVNYWKLSPRATMRDVILVIRADEDHHRSVNHTLGDMDLREKNPFRPGE